MPEVMDMPVKQAIGEAEIKRAEKILEDYKNGKKNLDNKITQNEEWWKLRQWESLRASHDEDGNKLEWTPATAWLWNVIVSKHADMMDGYPEPNVLPREVGDTDEARNLSSIIPVVLEQNNFKQTYDDVCWYKLKNGTGAYKISWNGQKLNGLGDIEISKVDILNLFWQPGITDIQKSKHFFHTELIDNDVLINQYPQLKEKIGHGLNDTNAKYQYDDQVDTSEQTVVVDWYYHRGNILHYCKFCNGVVLYATENETQRPQQMIQDPVTGMPMQVDAGPSIAEQGLYEHGLYPFVFDPLYRIEGSPCGYGYTDIGKDTQVNIDQLNAAIVKNALMASKRRYFALDGLDINLEEFANWEQDIVTVSSQMTDETLREITVNPLPGIYVQVLDEQINALKETTGNRDVNNGSASGGVTAASALAVLQEAGNKGSRDTIATTYEAYRQIILQVIELIRQFYNTPRQFRIIGEQATQEFVNYDNKNLRPQPQVNGMGMDMGFRQPEFDISVSASKATAYNKLSNNELALQFYNLQFFNPQNVDQALACIEMMDFDGKDEVIQRIEKNGGLLQVCTQLFQIAFGMAQAFDPNMIPQIMQLGVGAGVIDPQMAAQQTMASQSHGQEQKAINGQQPKLDGNGNPMPDEGTRVAKMRERMQNSTQPN